MESIEDAEGETNKMKIVLHACCGPCSTVPIKQMTAQGHELVVFYSNSNIHPEAEYIRRRDTIAAYLKELNIEFVEGTYNPLDWIESIEQNYEYGVERCKRCYRNRFAEPAEYAASIGADAIASSLTISPYQFTDAINNELLIAAQKNGVAAIESDYRKNYQDSVTLSREAGMYRQKYCGCMFSLPEAELGRYEAKMRRKQQKEQRKKAKVIAQN